MKPISNTAFYCCGIRMRDAESPRPICGDRFARQFMDARGLEIFRQFGGESGPNVSNVARHRYIDDLLRVQLERDTALQVVLIGCGFDSRAYRLAGGFWYELDEPQLIEYKDSRLPASQAPNPVRRIPIDFGTDSLQEKLRALAKTTPTVFVIEGVTMYLPAESLQATLAALASQVPTHRIIADLMTRQFIERYGRNIKRIIGQLGAQMIPGDDPARPFAQAGYLERSSVPLIGQALKYRSLGGLNPFLRRLLPGGYSGYTVREFERPTTSAP